MKKITHLIKKVLKEETKDNPDWIFYQTLTGGALLIPKKSNPKIKTIFDRESYKKKLDSLDEVRAFALKDRHAKEVCELYHKEEQLDKCYSRLVQHIYNMTVDNGLVSFEATLPDGKRQVFYACIRTREGGRVLDFDKRYLSGYYPEASPTGCYGNPWQLQAKDKGTSEDPENGQGGGGTPSFKITLEMNKG
jgi:hypothetical protein